MLTQTHWRKNGVFDDVADSRKGICSQAQDQRRAFFAIYYQHTGEFGVDGNSEFPRVLVIYTRSASWALWWDINSQFAFCAKHAINWLAAFPNQHSTTLADQGKRPAVKLLRQKKPPVIVKSHGRFVRHSEKIFVHTLALLRWQSCLNNWQLYSQAKRKHISSTNMLLQPCVVVENWSNVFRYPIDLSCRVKSNVNWGRKREIGEVGVEADNHERRARKRTGWKAHIEWKMQGADLPSHWRLTSTRTHSLPRTLVFRGSTCHQLGSSSLTHGPPVDTAFMASHGHQWTATSGRNYSATSVDFSLSATPASPPVPTLRLRDRGWKCQIKNMNMYKPARFSRLRGYEGRPLHTSPCCLALLASLRRSGMSPFSSALFCSFPSPSSVTRPTI